MSLPLTPILTSGLVAALLGAIMAGCSSRPTSSDPVAQTAASSPDPSPSLGQAPNSPAASSPQTMGQTPMPASDEEVVSQVQQEVEQERTLSKQNVGQTYLSSILRSQQAEHLVSGKFSPSLDTLQTGDPSETNEYQLQITQANQNQAIVVAIAKQPGLFSYVGAVYAVEARIPITGMCRTNEPSQTPPPSPNLMNKVAIVCPSGSTPVE